MGYPWALSELFSLSLQAETWPKQQHSTELTQQGSESSTYCMIRKAGLFGGSYSIWIFGSWKQCLCYWFVWGDSYSPWKEAFTFCRNVQVQSILAVR